MAIKLTNAHHIASAHNKAAVIHQAAADAVQSIRNGHVVMEALMKTFSDATAATNSALSTSETINLDEKSTLIVTVGLLHNVQLELESTEHATESRRCLHMVMFCLHSAAAFMIMETANTVVEDERVKDLRAAVGLRLSSVART